VRTAGGLCDATPNRHTIAETIADCCEPSGLLNNAFGFCDCGGIMQGFRLFFVIVLWGSLLAASPAGADGFLALGLSDGNPRLGFVYGYAPTAEQAMNLCRGIDKKSNSIPNNPTRAQKACNVVGDFTNACVAIAVNGTLSTSSTGVGWAIAPTPDVAEKQAMANCRSMAGKERPEGCYIQNKSCDGTAAKQ
jgi:hypothetical protein